MKRALTMVVILLAFFSLNCNIAFSNGHFRSPAAVDICGHFHVNDRGLVQFHYHFLPELEPITVPGQHPHVWHHNGRDGLIFIPTNFQILSIQDQQTEITHLSLSSPPLNGNFIYLGIGSGGIPL
jgi:hypothetical protein